MDVKITFRISFLESSALSRERSEAAAFRDGLAQTQRVIHVGGFFKQTGAVLRRTHHEGCPVLSVKTDALCGLLFLFRKLFGCGTCAGEGI